MPSLSVVSSGARHPFRKRLSRLNHATIKTSLRVIVSPYLFRSSLCSLLYQPNLAPTQRAKATACRPLVNDGSNQLPSGG